MIKSLARAYDFATFRKHLATSIWRFGEESDETINKLFL
ncbi:unknown protein [Cronobacter turicensis z3032]|uniref:Uncharacterized protein n=1 Tax=Cronobacter turicensis (strain DSM 18703 / CCUG 55852 / LMG 23827 / z3032) TaxID=693216 RepID=C9Y0R9_CROTZ|nr:unknown protein [Cronobacter turicensis z3032]